MTADAVWDHYTKVGVLVVTACYDKVTMAVDAMLEHYTKAGVPVVIPCYNKTSIAAGAILNHCTKVGYTAHSDFGCQGNCLYSEMFSVLHYYTASGYFP